MKPIFFPFALLLLLAVNPFNSIAQETSLVGHLIDADKLASGNQKDVLNSFFQLAFQDLTGPDKEVAFTANIYALRLKSNPDLNKDKNFVKPFTTFCRNSNVNWDLKLDTNYHFNGFNFGFKYAILNRRDYAISKKFLGELRPMLLKGDSIQDALTNVQAKHLRDTDGGIKIQNQINDYLDDKISYTELDPELKAIIRPFLKEYFASGDSNLFKLHAYEMDQYNSLISSYQNKLLWTIEGNTTTYPDQVLFSTIHLHSEAVKGMVPSRHLLQVELDIQATLDFLADSAFDTRNLKRSILAGEGGFNIMFKNASRSQSIAELKLQFAFNNVLTGFHEGEDENFFTLNGTLRFHISKDLWIPLEVKYDPNTGNVFGFLNVTSNFTWLNKLMGT